MKSKKIAKIARSFLFTFLAIVILLSFSPRDAIAEEVIVDDSSGQFTRYGNAAYWYQANIGYNSHIYYTRNVAVRDNYARWRPNISYTANFEVFAYIPNNYATTQSARYVINHAGGQTTRTINQNNYYNQWVSLGSYNFNSGTAGYVELSDVTGETALTKYIGFDAMKWVSPLSSPALSSPSNGATGVSKTPQLNWNDVSSATVYRVFVSTSYSTLNALSNTDTTCSGCLVWTPSSSYQDVPSGNLSGGTTYYWRVRAGNATQGSVNSDIWSFTTIPDLPNLSYYTPAGWDYPIVPSNSTGGHTVPGTLSACSPTYVDWSINNTTSNAVSSTFYTYLYLDGSQIGSWYTSGISGGGWVAADDKGPYTISAGSHTLRILTDSTSAISETSESDNLWERTFSWQDCGPSLPTIDASPTNPTTPSVTVNASCSDNGGNLDHARVANITTGWTSSNFAVSGYSGNFSSTVSLNTGSNDIRVTCWDIPGNSNSLTTTVTYTPPADLVPYQPSGWGSIITASSTPGTTSNGPLYTCQTSYLNFAVRNQGSANVSGSFRNYIYVGGSYNNQWTTSSLSSGNWDSFTNHQITVSAPGWHTISLTADAEGNIAESNEGNNSTSVDFYWNPCNSPTTTIDSPLNGFTTTQNSVTIEGRCSDPDGNLSSIGIQNSTYGWSTPASASGAESSFNVSVPLSVGNNSISAACYDSFGASHTSSVTVTADVCPDWSIKDDVGDACNHNEDGDGRDDWIDTCPTDPDDGVGDPCIHTDCADGSTQDSIGNACNHNDCADLTARDGWGEPCNHTDCPDLSPQDGIGDVCNHNDCADGSMRDNTGDPCIHNDCADGSLEDGTGNACNHTDCADGSPQDNWGEPCNHGDCPDLSAQDGVGAPCNHNDCADLSARDNWGEPCNHTDCIDFSAYDGIGDNCNHNDCADLSPMDTVGEPCNHDEDSDGISDGSDICPLYTNDSINNPCSPDDNANMVFTGSPIQVTVLRGEINQTAQFRVNNTGTGDMNYSFSTDETPQWINIVKNGGETDALSRPQHTLSAGATDSYTVVLNSTLVASAVNTNTLRIASSNDTSDGAVTLPVEFGVDDPPYCPLGGLQPACTLQSTATLGNTQPTIGTVSDPVNTATGNYAYHNTDLKLAGRGIGLSFSRTYNSQDKYLGPLGFGWAHTFNISAMRVGDDKVVIKWPDGRSETYTELFDGTYVAQTGVFSTLTEITGNLILITKDHTAFRFSETGMLISIEDRNGNTITLTYDEKSRLERVDDTVGRYMTFGYEDSDSLEIISVADSAGKSVSFDYDGSGDLIRFTDAEGNIYLYHYTDHKMTQVTDPRGNDLVRNTYDEYSRVVEQLDSLNNITEIEYEATDIGHVAVTDPLGQTLNQFYDEKLRIIESQDPFGNAIQYNYDPNNLRTGTTDRNLNNVSAEYDEAGNLISLTDPMGAVTAYEYDPATDDLIKVTEPNDHERNFEYDAEGNLTRTWEVVGGETIENRYTYNEWGQMTAFTDPMGNTTRFDYDGQGNLIATTDALGSVTHLGHDDAGRMISATNPLGETTQMQYNSNDQITTVIQPNGNSAHIEYDANGNRTRVTDPNGNATRLSWNKNNFLREITNPLGHITSFEHDKLNRRTRIIDPEGRIVRFAYDEAGNISSVTDPAGRITSLTHDNEGRLLSKTDPAGALWSYSYNDRSQVVSITDPFENDTQYEYDAATGFLTSTRDPLDRSTSYNYDILGRLTSSTDPLSGITSFEYDRNGRVINLTDAGGGETRFTYDSLGRKTGETNAIDETTQYFYNPVSRLTRSIDGKGQETQYNYDNLGRLLTTNYSPSPLGGEGGGEGGNISVSYAYDANGNRTGMIDPNGTAGYTYDAAGRLTSATDTRGFTFGYEYDRSGNLTRLAYPGGRTVDYAYNPSGQLTGLTDWLGNTTQYVYDTAGRISRAVLPNGFETAYAYDGASRLTQLINKKPDGTVLTSYDITLDALGNRIQIVKDEPLIPWIAPEEVTADYNLANELLNSSPSSSYTYDPNGNLTSYSPSPLGGEGGGEGVSYTFDARDLLTSMSYPEGSAEWVYDGDGNRIEGRTGETATQFIIDSNSRLPQVAAEADAGGAIQNYYIYGAGLTAKASADGSQIYYYHYNPVGSTIALSDSGGNITDQYLYDEFGALNRRTGNTPNPFQYVGQLGVQNDNTGLYYMRARYYDPTFGRFISRDPIEFAGGTNLYEYGKSNPLTYVDPDGLFAWGTFGTGLLELGKVALNLGATIGEALLSGGALAVGQGGVSGAFAIGAVGNLDNAMVNATNAVNNIVGAVRDKPATKLITQGPYRDLVEDVLGDTELFDTVQVAADIASIPASPVIGAKGLPAVLKPLSNTAKGNIGEATSLITNMARGNVPIGRQVITPIAGRKPIFDWKLKNILTGAKEIVESKFGTAGLSPAQRATAPYIPNLKVEQWTYDFWSNVGAGASTTGAIMNSVVNLGANGTDLFTNRELNGGYSPAGK